MLRPKLDPDRLRIPGVGIDTLRLALALNFDAAFSLLIGEGNTEFVSVIESIRPSSTENKRMLK